MARILQRGTAVFGQGIDGPLENSIIVCLCTMIGLLPLKRLPILHSAVPMVDNIVGMSRMARCGGAGEIPI